MKPRQAIPSHVSATLLALAVTMSLGAGADARASAAQLTGEAAPARTSQATLLQRLSEAARSLMAQAERRVVRKSIHRPTLRVAELRHLSADRRDPLAPHHPVLQAHLLNLPPPMRA